MADFLAAVAGAGSGYGYGRAIATPLSGTSATGDSVDIGVALKQSAFWRALAIRAGQFAMIPLELKKRERSGKTSLATDETLYKLTTWRPNRWQNAFVWKKHSYLHTISNGNMFNFLEKDQEGNVINIVPLTPARIIVRQDINGDVYYDYTNPITNYREQIPKYYILHDIGEHTLDGIVGISMIQHMANSIATAEKQQVHSAAMLENRATPSGQIVVSEKLSDTAYARLKKDVRELYQGVINSGAIPIFDNGAKWEGMSLSPQDLNLIQEKNFSITEISRFTGVPVHMLGINEKSTYDNVGQFKMEFLDFTLGHDLTASENNLNTTLIPENKRGKLFFKYNTDVYLRMDKDKQAEAHKNGRQWGYLSANEIREDLGKDPIEGEVGDMYWRPGNMVPADTPVTVPSLAAQSQTPASDTTGNAAQEAKKLAKEEQKSRVKRAAKRLSDDISARISNKMGNKLDQISKKFQEPEKRSLEFAKSLLEQREIFGEMILPSALSLAESQGDVSPILEAFITQEGERTLDKIFKAVSTDLAGGAEALNLVTTTTLTEFFEGVANKAGDDNG